MIHAISSAGAGEGFADWGQLLSYARNWIPVLNQYWYIVVYSGLALLLFGLAWNLIGDAFRDALDPMMQGARLLAGMQYSHRDQITFAFQF